MTSEANSRRPFDLARFEQLAVSWSGKFRYFPTISSTNAEARAILRQNTMQPLELGLVADEQTAGRGRLGRRWQAPPASSLLCSLALKLSPLPLERAFLYTASLALSVRRAAEELEPGTVVQLKWPNDLLRQSKKVGGILAELENNLGPARNESWLVLGFGLNLSLTATDLEEAGLSDKATNLTSQKLLEPEALLATILGYFALYRSQLYSNPAQIRQEWAAALATLGQKVQVLDFNGKVQVVGKAWGTGEDGALLVRASDGSEQRIQAGDVSIRLADGRYSL